MENSLELELRLYSEWLTRYVSSPDKPMNISYDELVRLFLSERTNFAQKRKALFPDIYADFK